MNAGQYSALVDALMRRRAARPQQPQEVMPMAPGGVMEMNAPAMPGQMQAPGTMAGGLAGGMGGGMSDMLRTMMQQRGNGPSPFERFQGWGADLGSRMPMQKSPLQTYTMGQTPTGGLY